MYYAHMADILCHCDICQMCKANEKQEQTKKTLYKTHTKSCTNWN